MKASYRERDHTFGQTMLTLRTELNLTQERLSNLLGVSRRAIGEWEAGNSYPKTEHLKELITLAVKGQAFPEEAIAQEIRALWKTAHQKVLLDESWLASLLEHARSPHLHLVPKSVEEGMETVETRRDTDRGCRDRGLPLSVSLQPLSACACPGASSFSTPTPTAPLLRADWGDALAVPIFYGREEELALLSQWIVQERCRVASVLGMGGIGKSTLAVNTMYRLAEHFEVVIFRSLHDAPSCEELIADCLQVFSSRLPGDGLAGQAQGSVPTEQRFAFSSQPLGDGLAGQAQGSVSTEQRFAFSSQPPGDGLAGQAQGFVSTEQRFAFSSQSELSAGQAQGSVPTEQRFSLLLSHLRQVRALVVLDNLECLLEDRDVRRPFRPGFEGYGRLLRRVAETTHQSCLLLTSREKPADLRPLESKHSPVRSLRLAGLDTAACQQLIEEKGLVGSQQEQGQFIEAYSGNPLALKIVGETIVDLFGGEIGPFLAQSPVIFGCITDLLDEQIARLSALEQTVLYWLAIMREPVTFDELLRLLAYPLPRVQILEAVDGLRQRSLIEPGKRPSSFALQAVVLEYVTEALIAEASSEIQHHRLDRLIQHSLCHSQASEYIRQTQERLLLAPLLAQLQSVYPRRAEMEVQLLSLLNELRERADYAQGYGPANLLALLRLQRGHLADVDLSHLSIRGA